MGHFKGHKGHFKGQDRKTRKARTPEAWVLTKTLNEKPESLAQTVLTIVLTIWQRYGDLIITSYTGDRVVRVAPFQDQNMY